MATAASPSSSIYSRPTHACIRCGERKVKCDRQRPCSACVKHKVDCAFNPPPLPRKKQKRVKDQILTDRLRHYESLLQEHGVDPSKLPDTPDSEPHHRSSHTVAVPPKDFHPQSPSSVESKPSRNINQTQVVHGHGRSKFVDNYLWTRVVEEFHDPEDALEDCSDDASDLKASDDDFAFVLGSRPKANTRSRHPPSDRIHQLWQIFKENIDPLTKIVHVPTLTPAIQKAASNTATIPRSFEALMFAIYAAAIMSLKDDECKTRLGEPRQILLSRYISGTKAALSRAKFMGTISLVVLQALVLHLLSVRDIYEPRTVWSLTGVAIRIAQSMGLERDGESLGLPPFEAEMRRRIWWLLKTHDFRTAELCGQPKLRDIDIAVESTKGPTNINDDQLYPGMPSLQDESNTLTDAVFVGLIYELVRLGAGRVASFRRQGKNSNQWDLHASGNDKIEIEEAFREVEAILETKYLRYCDPSQPLHLMTMLIARSSMNIFRFLTNHPRRWAWIEQTPFSERQWVWEISVSLLEQHNMMQSNPQLKRFAWHAAYWMQWHSFINVLDTLRANPLIADAEKAWQLIDNTYENNPDMVFDTKKPIHVAVGNLCLKAYSAHETTLQNEKMSLSPTPEFIMQLRQQREAAKVRREERLAKSGRPEDQVNHGQANASEMDPRPDTGVPSLSNTLESTYLQQSTTSDPPSLAQTGGSTIESDSFWFINGFVDSQVDNSNDMMMGTDADLMLAQDHSSVEGDAAQAIDWEQWDAWLGDSNGMRLLQNRQHGT